MTLASASSRPCAPRNLFLHAESDTQMKQTKKGTLTMKPMIAVLSVLGVVSVLSHLIADDAAPAEATKAAIQPADVSDAEAKQAEELFQDGRKLFFQGKYLDAAKKLEAAVAANPNKTGYQLLLAKAYRYGQQPDKAVKSLERILKVDADHVEAAVQLAELVSPQKNPDRVIGVLEPLLKFKHDYPLYHLLAEAHYEKEQFDKARGYYEKAVSLNPKSQSDHYQLGNIYLAQKRFAKAASSYETAGRLGMSSGVYHFKLASVYFNLRNYLGRVSTAEVIGGKEGQLKDQYFLIGAVPGQQDKFYVAGIRSAIYQARKAQEMGIDVFDIRFLEANVWLSARRYANAARIYAEIQEKVRKEDQGLFWYSWAQAALGLNDYDNYLVRLNKAIEAAPDIYKGTLADAYVTIATRYHQRGDSQQYVNYLSKAVENNPLSARLHLTLGDAHWLSNHRDAAIQQYKLVLELEPDHSQRVRLLNRIRGQEEAGG